MIRYLGLLIIFSFGISKHLLNFLIVVFFNFGDELSNFRIVTQIVNETYDNDDDLDLTYVIIVWIANLPRYLGNVISNVEHLEQNPNIMYNLTSFADPSILKLRTYV